MKIKLLVAIICTCIFNMQSQVNDEKTKSNNGFIGFSYFNGIATKGNAISMINGAQMSIYWHLFNNKNFFFEYDFGVGYSANGLLLRLPAGASVGALLLIASANADTSYQGGLVALGILACIVPNAIGYHLDINDNLRCNIVVDPLNALVCNSHLFISSGIGAQLDYRITSKLIISPFINLQHGFNPMNQPQTNLLQVGITVKK